MTKRQYLNNAMDLPVRYLLDCIRAPGQMPRIHVALLRIALRRKMKTARYTH